MWREAGSVAGGDWEQQLPLMCHFWTIALWLGEVWLFFRATEFLSTTSSCLENQQFPAGGDMTSGRVLVYGGKGALGSAIVSKFKVC